MAESRLILLLIAILAMTIMFFLMMLPFLIRYLKKRRSLKEMDIYRKKADQIIKSVKASSITVTPPSSIQYLEPKVQEVDTPQLSNCVYCGKEIILGSEYCPECGTKLNEKD